MGYVDGSIVAPPNMPDTLVEYTKWLKKDSQAFCLLCQALNKKYLKNVSSCKTSHPMWSKLKLLHECNAIENVHALQQSFYKCQLGSEGSIAAYLGEIDVIVT